MKFPKFLTLVATGLILNVGLLVGDVENGSNAPAFTLTDTNGVSHSLSDFAGSFVVLEWINHECPFVKKHYDSGNMQSLQKKWTENGVVWLSINSTNPNHRDYKTPEEANQLTEAHNATPTAVLMDPAGQVGKAYGAATTPHMYIIDPAGNLVYQGAIDSIPNARVASITDRNLLFGGVSRRGGGCRTDHHGAHEEHEGKEFGELSRRVIGCAIEVHRFLGPGMLDLPISDAWAGNWNETIGLFLPRNPLCTCRTYRHDFIAF